MNTVEDREPGAAKEGLHIIVVVPVYNEEGCVRQVLEEWLGVIESVVPAFQMLVINDGSTDGTPAVLESLARDTGSRLQILHQENRGHGPACLRGYRLAVESGAEWIFQIDSDGQCDPRYFSKFWEAREDTDAVFGRRFRREDGMARMTATRILELLLWLRTGAWCVDPNVPYRLIRAEALERILKEIPPEFSLGNVAVAAMLQADRDVRHRILPIVFRRRSSGQSKASLAMFARAALTLWREYPGRSQIG